MVGSISKFWMSGCRRSGWRFAASGQLVPAALQEMPGAARLPSVRGLPGPACRPLPAWAQCEWRMVGNQQTAPVARQRSGSRTRHRRGDPQVPEGRGVHPRAHLAAQCPETDPRGQQVRLPLLSPLPGRTGALRPRKHFPGVNPLALPRRAAAPAHRRRRPDGPSRPTVHIPGLRGRGQPVSAPSLFKPETFSS